MTVNQLQNFLMWCTIINGGLLTVWASAWLLAPQLTFRTQRRWFPLSEQEFSLFFYGFLGLFKIFFLIFNLVPWIAVSLLQ